MIPKSIPNIFKLFDNLLMLWMGIWIHHHHCPTTTLGMHDQNNHIGEGGCYCHRRLPSWVAFKDDAMITAAKFAFFIKICGRVGLGELLLYYYRCWVGGTSSLVVVGGRSVGDRSVVASSWCRRCRWDYVYFWAGTRQSPPFIGIIWMTTSSFS